MRIGIDLGGSKIEGVALDGGGTVRFRERVNTPVGDYDGTLMAIAQMVSKIETALGAKATVGVGTPGAISTRTGLIKNANSTILNGKPLDRDLERILARPVRLDNDANCFALSEAVDGAASDARVVFGVILGTGVGGGVVVGRQLIAGRNRIAGEWGHNPLPWMEPDEWSGPPCYCGKVGCIETFLSGPAMSQQFLAATGKRLSGKEIALAADAGDEAAIGALEIYANRLARGLAHVVNLLDPDKIVLGGGLSNIKRLFTTIPDLIQRYVFSDGVEIVIVPARHGDSSGVRGAAWLWPA